MSERMFYPTNPSESLRAEAKTPTELLISEGTTEAKIMPEKGGMVTSLTVAGEEVLFVDTEALADPKNPKPKAGIPVLLPYAGNITKEVGLQHGGAREVPWVWLDKTADSVEASLDSRAMPDEMRGKLKEIYGDDFEYKTTIKTTVGEGSLRYDLKIKNNSHQSMPFAPGLHPYFSVDRTKRGEVSSNLADFDLSKMDQDHPLVLDRPKGEVWFTTPDGKRITFDLSPEFKHIVVWAVDGADHLCVEPFVANPRELREYMGIAAGEEADLSVGIRVEEEKVELPRLSESARGDLRDFMEKAAEVEELFDFDEWMLNKDNGDYTKKAGEALNKTFSAYLLMIGAADKLIIAGDAELRAMGMELQKAIGDDKSISRLANEMQTDIVWLTSPRSHGIEMDRKRLDDVQEFVEKTVLIAAELMDKIRKYEEKKLGYQPVEPSEEEE